MSINYNYHNKSFFYLFHSITFFRIASLEFYHYFSVVFSILREYIRSSFYSIYKIGHVKKNVIHQLYSLSVYPHQLIYI